MPGEFVNKFENRSIDNRQQSTIDKSTISNASASGLLIAFEGLDQSGKQTQAELVRDRLTSSGRSVRLDRKSVV